MHDVGLSSACVMSGWHTTRGRRRPLRSPLRKWKGFNVGTCSTNSGTCRQRCVAQAMAPSLLQLLVQDYARWAVGLPRSDQVNGQLLQAPVAVRPVLRGNKPIQGAPKHELLPKLNDIDP